LTFQDFNFHSELAEGIEAMGFENPTPVQQQAIPHIIEGKDLIACAQTGTGKTAAYLLPTLNQLVNQPTDQISTLIIVPTRELAVQIDQQLEGFCYFTNVSSITIYGGSDGATFDRQKAALKKGTQIIVATPGKLISHLNLGYVNLSHLKHFILDEADRMLDMGFYEDIMRIHSFLPEKKQNLLFSATMPPKIRQLSKQLLHEPEEVNIAISKTASGILQAAFILYDHQKLPLLEHLLKAKKVNSLIVFCARKVTVKEIAEALKGLDYEMAAISSDLEQKDREDIMRKFRNKQLQVLIATDILSRGIDVEGIELIINHDVPQDAEDYVHRVGRTARADKKGAAFTFVGPKEQRSFAQIEQLIELDITKAKLPEYLGETPDYNPNSGKSRPKGGGKRRNSGGGRKSKSRK
jgi:superfamily II DNA/RNA helicase